MIGNVGNGDFCAEVTQQGVPPIVISQTGLNSQNLAANTNTNTIAKSNDNNNTNSNTTLSAATPLDANGNDNKDENKDENDESKQESEDCDEKTDESKMHQMVTIVMMHSHNVYFGFDIN